MDPQQQKKQPEDPQAQRLPDWMRNWRKMRDKLYGDAEESADEVAAKKKAKAEAEEDIKAEAAARILAKEIALREGEARAELLDTIRDLFTHKAADEGKDIPAAPETKAAIGNTMPDGTIYAGTSPETQAPIFAAPADEPHSVTFNRAVRRAEKSNRQKRRGHEDWRLPTKDELDQIYCNNEKGAFAGTFDRSSKSWYWTANRNIPDTATKATVQNFRTGTQKRTRRSARHKVRLVR